MDNNSNPQPNNIKKPEQPKSNQPQGPAPNPQVQPAPTQPTPGQSFGPQKQQPVQPQPQQQQSGPMSPNMAPMGQPQKKDTLGLISLILIIFSPLIGAIIGFIGMSKAKKEGYNGTKSKIGAIVNTILFVLGILFLVLFFVVFSSDEVQDALEEVNSTNQSSAPGPIESSDTFEIEFLADIGGVCEGKGWPSNAQSSSSGNVVAVFSNSSTFPDTYTNEFITGDGFETVTTEDNTTFDKIVCVSAVGQEPISVTSCDYEIDGEQVKAPMSLRPYQATVYEVSSKSEVATFIAQPKDRCPFFVAVNPDDNSFDADLDEDSFTEELVKVL